MKSLCTLAFILSSFGIFAQGWAEDTRFETGSWTTANVKYELSPKVNLFAEGQFRSQRTYNDFNYWELKTFAHYIVNENFFIGGGIGNYHQYLDYENFGHHQKQTEFRIWQEMVIKNSVKRFNFEHRYRVEQRFINKWNPETRSYQRNYGSDYDEDRFRFRYRIQLNVPLNHAKMQKNTFYFNTSNEIHLTHKKPFFNQNRFFTGFGYKMEHMQIQAGLMHQFLNGNSFQRTKNYLQVTFNYTITNSFHKR